MISATVVAVVIGGILAAGQVQLPTAEAAGSTDSKITVKWTGDDSLAKDFQPERDPKSPHLNDFKKLSVTVSQTTGIIDQAIRVSVAGFAGTKSSGVFAKNEQNFMQAMQCWGADPLAKDFRETCQWGGRLGAGNGLGDSVYFDNTLRVASRDADAFNPTKTGDVPFRTPGGAKITGKPKMVNGVPTFDLLSYFGPSTTNEVTSARVGSNGTGYFDFETQTADQAPQLGCGSAEHLRCWLVLVPRGRTFGGSGEACSQILDPANHDRPYEYGQSDSIQAGSPLNPGCDYWNNRISVPLDFSPLGTKCAIGGSEQRVIGSQLMVGAMSSWQPSLCQTIKSTFSFSTNPDAVARAQVLETSKNSPELAFMGFPLSPGDLSTADERDLLAKTQITYAPVAISSVVIAFFAEFDAGRQQELVLSPRLMAKLLTQSYKFTVPWNTTDPSRNFAHLPKVNQSYGFLNDDPDFQQLNPTNYNEFTGNPAVILPGPASADAIIQVWRWILADKEAVAFLDGTPDRWGMSINPYYLPKGDPKAVVPSWIDVKGNYTPTSTPKEVGLTNLDGSPKKLSRSVPDNFAKDDGSLVPLNRTIERTRFDSIQFAPYTDNLLTGARQAFRADPNSKTSWDQNKINSSGDVGDWVSSGAQLPGQKFMIAITDSPSALRYSLSTAALTLPNSTSAVKPENKAMADALGGLAATSLDSVRQVDPAKMPATGYPLTMVTYAAVNLPKTTKASRVSLSDMIKQISTSGQIPGSALGELPAGYLPLTSELQAAAAAAASEVQKFTPPTPAPTPPPATVAKPSSSTNMGIAQDDFVADPTAIEDLAKSEDPTTTSNVDALSIERTGAVPVGGPGSAGIILALVFGLAGLLIAPILFRGSRRS